MLDTKQTWDDLVRRHAPDAATRDAILANPLYKNITGRSCRATTTSPWSGSTRSTRRARYDLIVVDTPPTRNAIDFLEAPERMADFFSSRLLRWLTVPARSRVLTMASKPFYSVADRILGSQFLEDIAEFFLLFQTMYDGFVERAKAVTRTLEDKRTTFVVVSTLESAPVREAEFFIEALDDRGLHLGAVVLNKVLPGWFLDKGDATAAAKELCARSDELAAGRPRPTGAPEQVARVLREVGRELPQLPGGGQARGREARRAGAAPEVVAAVPVLRPRHQRPRRAAPPRRADLAVSGATPLPRRGRVGAPGHHGRGHRGARGGRQRRRRVRRRRASRPPSPSPASPAWPAAASSSPARAPARRCCSTSSSTRRAAACRRPTESADFDEVVVRFSGAEQGFHVRARLGGGARAASPGCLHAHAAPRSLRAGGRHRAGPASCRARASRSTTSRPYLLAHPRADPHPHARGGGSSRPAAGCSAGATGFTNPALAAFLGDARPTRGFAEPALAAAVERRHGRAAAVSSPPPTSPATGSSSASRSRCSGAATACSRTRRRPSAVSSSRSASSSSKVAPGGRRRRGPAAHAIALAEAMIATDAIRAAVGWATSSAPVDRRHHPRERRRRRGRRRRR